MHIEGPHGGRDVEASEFFDTYLTSSLEAGELLTEVRFPSAPPGAGAAFLELVRRKGDFAIFAAAASVEMGGDGACKGARLALAGVSDTPIRCDAPSAILVGRVPTAELLREAASAACEGIEPESDVLASGEYRRAMAPVYARRALASAVARATTQS
ncbi:MAG: molybdopterin dehydrogenase FAD-binding protein [Chloroflexi bacterium]|nr:molybdopterin dehydrogenase FAD-binding protein [Chloroflexota bacterium]